MKRRSRLVVCLSGLRLLIWIALTLAGWGIRARDGGRVDWLAGRVALVIPRLGPGGLKLVQFLSVRYDLIPPQLTAAFACARSSVETGVIPVSEAVAGWRAEPVTSESVREVLIQSTMRIADAGSAACVVLVTPAPGCANEEALALKVLRPGAAESLDWTAGAIHRFGNVAALAFQPAVPIAEISGRLAFSLREQTDLRVEQDRYIRARACMARYGIEVEVPKIAPGLSNRSGIAMDWVPPAIGCNEIERRHGVAAIRAVFALIFDAGLVHCDVHPGNMYVGDGGQLILLDFGYCYELSRVDRRRFADFFVATASGSGIGAWKAVFDSMDGMPGEFERLILDYSRRPSHEFNVREFGQRLISILKASARPIPPAFFFPLLALMVLEGTLHEWGVVGIDFQELAAPFALEAVLTEGEEL